MKAVTRAGQQTGILTNPVKLGVLLFIGSEVAFFFILISAYVYFQAWAVPGPNASNSLHVGLSAIFTACLLASSFTIWRADKNLAHDNRIRTSLWLGATLVLGIIFLLGQGREYISLYSENITIGRNLFGSTFFTLTGFHGLHVFGGLVAIWIVLSLCIGGDFKGGRSTALEAVSMYWHFVDAVWIVLFTLIYLWPIVA